MFNMLGRIAAVLTVLYGALEIVLGLLVAYTHGGDPAAVRRDIGSVASTGEAIDQGIFVVLVGSAFGVLVEISRSLKRIADHSALQFEDGY